MLNSFNKIFKLLCLSVLCRYYYLWYVLTFSGDYGQIILVATHVDLTRAVKTQQGEWVCPDAQKTLESVKKLLPHIPNLMDLVIIMDSNVPASFAFKQLKSVLANIKQNIIQVNN